MMRELEEVRNDLLAGLPRTGLESRPLAEAQDFILADTVEARMALPPFDNSAMDGFALRAADVRAVPAVLRVVGAVAAGEAPAVPVGEGEAVRIFTGAPLPPGADAVVMQEDTEPDPAAADRVRILDRVKPWENIRFRGEDVAAGAPMLSAGRRLDPGALALLAACGVPQVTVHRRPRVTVLVTGNELVAPGTPLLPGQIHESNAVMLAGLVRRAGGEPRCPEPVRDDPEAVRSALTAAAAESDLVLTVGGASVGEHDHVRQSVVALGGSVDVWRIALKPGKPFFHARLGGCPVLGLPGNPVSAFVTSILLVLPALRTLQGESDVLPPACPGVLGESLANSDRRRHFVRVVVDSQGVVRSSGLQASHRLASLAAANGLVDVPPGTTLPAGAAVSVIRW